MTVTLNEPEEADPVEEWKMYFPKRMGITNCLTVVRFNAFPPQQVVKLEFIVIYLIDF